MPNKKDSTSHYARIRRELAAALGYDVENLSALQAMKLDNAVALRLVSDAMRASLMRGEDIDHRELLAVTEGLAKLLPEEPKATSDGTQRAHGQRARAKLKNLIANFIAADEAAKAEAAADRREQGLPAQPSDYETALSEIETLRSENASLRAMLPDAGPKALPSPTDEAITPSIGDIVPPGEQSDRHLYVGKRYTPDDLRVMQPKPVIEGTATAVPEGSWTGPKDGCPPWLRKAAPAKPEHRINGGPPATVNGDEAKRRMDAANGDRSLDFKVMQSPSRVTGEPAPSLDQRFRR